MHMADRVYRMDGGRIVGERDAACWHSIIRES
jgi:hypothetical protein